MSPSSEPSGAHRVCWRVEGLFLPRMPACLCVGDARQAGDLLDQGPRAGSRPAHLYTAYVVPMGLEVKPEIIPSWDRGGQFLLDQPGGGSPFICFWRSYCWQVTGSLQFRSPCGACVRDRGRPKGEVLFRCEEGAQLGRWGICCCSEPRTITRFRGGPKMCTQVLTRSDHNSRCLVCGPSVFVLINVLCCFILMELQLSNPITQSGTEEI